MKQRNVNEAALDRSAVQLHMTAVSVVKYVNNRKQGTHSLSFSGYTLIHDHQVIVRPCESGIR